MSAQELGQVLQIAGELSLVLSRCEALALGDIGFRKRVEYENGGSPPFGLGINVELGDEFRVKASRLPAGNV